MTPAISEQFRAYAAASGLSLTEDDAEALIRGARWLAQASTASGLSQYATPDEALLRAMGPALAYFRTGGPVTGFMADLGCGNGAIGATIALFAPNLAVDLVDRAKRAYTTAELLVRKLRLENARARQADLASIGPLYDVAVFRALAPADRALPLAASVVRSGGWICAYHRAGDAGFESPDTGFEPLETHETLVSHLVLTCYRK